MHTQEHTVSALNELLKKNQDAARGYETAAENVPEEGLKNFFRNRAQQRDSFSRELESEIRAWHGEPAEGGSATGSLHRAWMDLKATFSGNSSEATLEECIRGEKASVENYREVLEDPEVPATLRTKLLTQIAQIEEMLLEVKTLEDLQ